jgi:DNA-binding NarL/FixJ family response regulator
VIRMPKPKLPPGVLTPRERELLPLFASGLTIKEVGTAKNIATSTASVHLYSIMKKFGVHHMRGLAAHVTPEVPNVT